MTSQISKCYFLGTLDCMHFKINSIIMVLALNRLEPKDHTEEISRGLGTDAPEIEILHSPLF